MSNSDLTNTTAGSGGAGSLKHQDMLAELARYVWSKRKLIATVLGIAIPIYALILILIPAKFRAEADVIIMPPRFTSQVRTEPLSVATAKNLLESGELAQQVIDRITAGHKVVLDYVHQHKNQEEGIRLFAALSPQEIASLVGESPERPIFATYLAGLTPRELNALADYEESDLRDWTVENLRKHLESEDVIEKKTASDIKMTPLLKLYAVAASGPKAQLIANTWASVFETKYEELSTGKTKRQYDSILGQQQSSQTELVDIQTSIVKFKKDNNIDLYQELIREYTEEFSNYTSKLMLKQYTLRSEEARLDELLRILQAIESNGRWVGEVEPLVVLSNAGFTSMTLPLTQEGGEEVTTSALPEPGLPRTVGSDEITSALVAAAAQRVKPEAHDDRVSALGPVYEKMRVKVVQSRDEFERCMKEWEEFYYLHPVQVLESERNQLQDDYLDGLSKLRHDEVRLVVVRKTLADLDRELSSTQQFITLAKSAPDVSVADAARTGREQLQGLARIDFKGEQLNPVWSALQDQRVKLERELISAENEVLELESVLPERFQELREKEQLYNQARLRERAVEQNLARWRKSNETQFNNYMQTNDMVYGSAREMALLRREVTELEQATTRTKALAEVYQEKFNESTAELERLTLRQKAVQRNADLLLQKLQEAQLAKSEDVSDVSIAASAVTPMEHFFPPRTILMVLLTLLTAAVIVGGLARTRYLELKSE